jgi:hypothetical protein
MDAATGFQVMWAVMKAGVQGSLSNPEATGGVAVEGGNVESLSDQIDALLRKNEEFRARLNEPWKPTAGRDLHTGGEPSLAAPENTAKMIDQFNKLADATTGMLNKDTGDKLAGQIAKINEEMRKWQEFLLAHPRMWLAVNGYVAQLQSEVNALVEQQTRIKGQMESGVAPGVDRKKGLEGVLGAGYAVPTVSGQVQQQREMLKLQDDANERNRLGLSLYEQMQTAGERWALELQKLNLLLADGNITQETYNRLKQQEVDRINGGLDLQVRANELLRQYNDLKKQGLLTDTADALMQKQYADIQARANAQKGGAGAGVAAGGQIFKNQWQGIGTESMDSTIKALSGMQNAFSRFFEQIASGTKGIGKTFEELGRNMLVSFLGTCAQLLSKWIFTHTAMAAFQAVFHTQTAAQDTAANAAKYAQTVTTNALVATSEAAVAAAGAFASAMIALPFPINMIVAPAMGATALSEGMGFVALTSAAQGYDIPHAVNPIVQLHQREMVLPENLADNVRKGTGGHTFHFHVQGATDPEETANRVMAKVNTMFRSNGVMR